MNKAVILHSTMHFDKLQGEEKKNNLEIIFHYNKAKGGVDTMDQMVPCYTSKRVTKRWLLILWYNMINIAALNAYTIFTQI